VSARGSRSRWAVIGLLAAGVVCGFASKADAGAAVAILALAALPALFAVPPRGRPVVAAAIVAAAVFVAATAELGDDGLAWTAVCLVCAAGITLALRGATWPPLASRFGDSPDRTADKSAPDELWKALDRGEDPTERGDAPES
jgi:hypothetical protein